MPASTVTTHSPPPIHTPPWVGSSINPRRRILILGESWYGPGSPLTVIPAWCAGATDHFFTRIFNAASGVSTSSAPAGHPARLAFWNSVLFDNFVNWPVGPSLSNRPTCADFTLAATIFPARIAGLAPDSVWVLGKTQALYSSPLIISIRQVISPHPRWHVTTAVLKADWSKL